MGCSDGSQICCGSGKVCCGSGETATCCDICNKDGDACCTSEWVGQQVLQHEVVWSRLAVCAQCDAVLQAVQGAVGAGAAAMHAARVFLSP